MTVWKQCDGQPWCDGQPRLARPLRSSHLEDLHAVQPTISACDCPHRDGHPSSTIVMLFMLAVCSGGEPPETADCSPSPTAPGTSVVNTGGSPPSTIRLRSPVEAEHWGWCVGAREARRCCWRPGVQTSSGGRDLELLTNSLAARACAHTTVREPAVVIRLPTGVATQMMWSLSRRAAQGSRHPRSSRTSWSLFRRRHRHPLRGSTAEECHRCGPARHARAVVRGH